jgi:hypothetical protein
VDFIERIFGIDPDGGTGFTEILILGLAVAALLAFGVYRSRRSAKSRHSI